MELLICPSTSTNFRRLNPYAEIAISTLSIALDEIKEQIPLAAFLMRMMAYIDRINIPYEFLARSGVDGSRDDILTDDAIFTLQRFSLLDATTSDVIGDQQERTYEINSTIYNVMRFIDSAEENAFSAAQAVNALLSFMPRSGDFECWKAWRVYFPCVNVLVDNFSEDNLDIAEICSTTAWYMERINDRSAKPISLAERSVEVRARLLGGEDRKTLISIDILMQLLTNNCNNLEMAEEIGRKLVETQSRLYGEEAELTLISMGNIAVVYHKMKKWEEAEHLEAKTLEIRRKILGEGHQETLTVMHNLAITYKAQGRMKEAIELEQKAFEGRARVLGKDHPWTKQCAKHLAAWRYI
ncbi:hypothetical protein FPQ18DRAFT_129057 [Pyronema domesticum]|nr:hypothetical protein FPQ18DRAFT_129057 [Pyronema domesticum]